MSAHGGGGDDGGDSGRWLVSYADFITLLFVLFVVMWAMGQTDIQKFRQLAESMRAAFSFGGAAARQVDPSINQGGGSQKEGVPNPIEIPGIPKKPPASVDIASQLSKTLSKYDVGGGVSIHTSVEGVLITMSEKLLFKPGTADLDEDAYPVLDAIVPMLNEIENKVRVVGHTDNTPPEDPKYSNNWELSIGRAWVIARYLIDAGVAPERISVEGRGEYQPIFLNDTPEHKALNSRADIVIIYDVESNVISGESPIGAPR